MFTWLAHLAFVGFFSSITWLFLSAIRSNVFNMLVFALGIQFVIQVTIADLSPIVEQWSDRIDSGLDIIQRAAGKDG